MPMGSPIGKRCPPPRAGARRHLPAASSGMVCASGRRTAMQPSASPDPWPSLPLEDWKDTYATLHRWAQIVGKIRLARSPWINHSWHVTLYVTARGLTTSPIPYGTRTFQLDFDFIDHGLLIQTGEGAVRTIAQRAHPVAEFFAGLFAPLREHGLEVKIHPAPNVPPYAIPPDTDR